MIDWKKEAEEFAKQNACISCGEQKKTVITGTDWSAAPKSLPVAMTSRQCKTEGCNDFSKYEVW
jgi:hypothetical protein